MSESTTDKPISTRWPEVIVAVFLLIVAGLVIKDSLRVGIGWADDGPRSGYFPFYIGLLLATSSGLVLLGQLRHWARTTTVFAQASELSLVWSMLWPMVVYVGLIKALGIYVASLILIAYFMKRHGGYGWLLTVAVSVGVPLFFFLVFEKWFLVLLPKGPLEAMLGL
jgi:putative tricarboxylic transport membrane protein